MGLGKVRNGRNQPITPIAGSWADDLDSTGHVFMTDPDQQERENDFYSQFDAKRELFDEGDTHD